MKDSEAFSLIWDEADARDSFASFAFQDALKINQLLYLRDENGTDKQN